MPQISYFRRAAVLFFEISGGEKHKKHILVCIHKPIRVADAFSEKIGSLVGSSVWPIDIVHNIVSKQVKLETPSAALHHQHAQTHGAGWCQLVPD